jgi:hypothetical protein
MTFLAKPSVAVGFGAVMLCAETCDHWDEIARLDWLSMPLHDWTAALLLIAVGVVHRRDYRAIAWAFMLSLLSARSSAILSNGWARQSPTRGYQSESCFQY